LRPGRSLASGAAFGGFFTWAEGQLVGPGPSARSLLGSIISAKISSYSTCIRVSVRPPVLRVRVRVGLLFAPCCLGRTALSWHLRHTLVVRHPVRGGRPVVFPHLWSAIWRPWVWERFFWRRGRRHRSLAKTGYTIMFRMTWTDLPRFWPAQSTTSLPSKAAESAVRLGCGI